MIRRHLPCAIWMHWSNAVCWLLLLGSGFGLLANPAMQPLGRWWSALWTGALGASGLLGFHVALGLAWIALYAIFLIFCTKRVALPFLREILTLSPRSDGQWCLRKGLWLVFGPRPLRRLGVETALPPQGFYNAGQKCAAIAAVASSLGLVVTGLLMVFFAGKPGSERLLQWCLLGHFCCAGLMALVLPVHMYMAALAPGEGPSLRSMFTGRVPLEFARHHNPLWVQRLAGQDRDKEA